MKHYTRGDVLVILIAGIFIGLALGYYGSSWLGAHL